MPIFCWDVLVSNPVNTTFFSSLLSFFQCFCVFIVQTNGTLCIWWALISWKIETTLYLIYVYSKSYQIWHVCRPLVLLTWDGWSHILSAPCGPPPPPRTHAHADPSYHFTRHLWVNGGSYHADAALGFVSIRDIQPPLYILCLTRPQKSLSDSTRAREGSFGLALPY